MKKTIQPRTKALPPPLFYRMLVHAGWAHIERPPELAGVPDAEYERVAAAEYDAVVSRSLEAGIPVASDLETRALHSVLPANVAAL